VLAAGPLSGCGGDRSCDTGEMQCWGDTVQLCNADRDWVDWLDCFDSGKACYADRDHCGGWGDIACCD